MWYLSVFTIKELNGFWIARYQSSKDNSLELPQVCEGLIGDTEQQQGTRVKCVPKDFITKNTSIRLEHH